MADTSDELNQHPMKQILGFQNESPLSAGSLDPSEVRSAAVCLRNMEAAKRLEHRIAVESATELVTSTMQEPPLVKTEPAQTVPESSFPMDLPRDATSCADSLLSLLQQPPSFQREFPGIKREVCASAPPTIQPLPPRRPSFSFPATQDTAAPEQLTPLVTPSSDGLNGGNFSILPYHGDTSPILPTTAQSEITSAPPQHFGLAPSVLSSKTGLLDSRKVFTCQQCGFQCRSKFHFNSHMNTHSDHRCKYCDYTSRTEGRLNRHMQEFHSRIVPTASSNQTGTETFGDRNGSSQGLTDQASEIDFSDLLGEHSESSRNGGPSNGINQELPNLSSSGQFQPAEKTISGRQRTYKCKQCGYIARSKDESWLHARTHITPDKQLNCPKCFFVTEYKHHLEYHLRNHYNSKPFKCEKCEYTCVNKSMLNSHMKSHSHVYQFRCIDCDYETKYCHSLKMHLRKYAHRPASIIGADGKAMDPSTMDNPRNGSRDSSQNSLESPEMDRQCLPQGSVQTPPGHPIRPLQPFDSTFLPLMTLMQSGMQQNLLALQTNGLMSGVTQPPMNMLPTMSSDFDPASVSGADSPISKHVNGVSPNTNQVFKCSACNFSTNNVPDLALHLATQHKDDMQQTGLQNPMSNGGKMSSVSNQILAEGSPNSIPVPAELMMSNGTLSVAGGILRQNSAKSVSDEQQQLMVKASNQDTRSALPGSRINSPFTTRNTPSHESASSSNGGKSSDDGGSSGESGFGSRFKARSFKVDQISLKLRLKRCQSSTPTDGIGAASNSRHSATPDSQAGPMAAHDEAAVSADSNITPEPQATTTCADQSAVSSAQAPSSQDTLSEATVNDTNLPPNGHLLASPTPEAPPKTPTPPPAPSSLAPQRIDWSNAFVCQHCEMAFKNIVLYTLHMTYHTFQNPFRCNMCGFDCATAVDLCMHVAQYAHLQKGQ